MSDVRVVDLSQPIDASGWEPEPITMDVLSPADGAKHMSEEMKKHFDIDFDPSVLPDAELLSIDTLTLTTHTGTHIDAPSHYGTRAAYGPRPWNIDEVPLEWFHRPGIVLDVTDAPVGSAVDADYLEKKFAQAGVRPEALDIVLLYSGADARVGTPAFFTDFVGLDASAIDLLLGLGVRVIGTDGFSLDAPFTSMLRRFQDTGDRSVLWPAHFAGREIPYCQIERLANLGSLPAHGFTMVCFPIKIVGAGAGWARAVALLDD